MERDFKWIWIPKEIWLSEDLTIQEKIFYVEIDSLDNENWCYANNEYFAKFFWLSKVRVSEIINSLIRKWYIESCINKELGNKRILKTLLKKSLRPYTRKVEDPIKEKFKHNNIINNTSNNILSKDNTETSSEIVKVDKRILEIDIILESLKECNMWILDDTIKKQRQYWKLIKDKLLSVKWFNWDYARFITYAYNNSDEYRRNHFRSAEKFYYNLANIVAWIKIKAETKPKKMGC